MRPKRTWLLLQLRAASVHITWFLGRRMPDTFPLTFVTGHPRSGTVWASQLVADYLQLPYPRFSYLPIGFPAVVHAHLQMRDDYPRAVYVVRDPRDVMISLYFFKARVAANQSAQSRRTQHSSVPLDRDRIAEHLPAFIEQQMRPRGIFSTRLNWSAHVRTYLQCRNDRTALLRYEELLHNGPEHLARAMEVLTGEAADMQRIREALDRYSFARQAGRDPNKEDRNSPLRKGKAGDWKNHFSREAAEILDRFCGEVMIEMGYAQDRAWIDQCLPLAELVSQRQCEEAVS